MENNAIETRIIHNYRILNSISSGAFGSVYRAQHIRKPNEMAAIKIEHSHNANAVLKHEARILQHLQQNGVKCIPTIYWYGMHMESPTLIMPLYTCSIDYYARNKSITVGQLSALIAKCVRILEHIHRYYVVHRDIKPANFMVHNGNIYLIDFGLATFYLDETAMHYADSAANSLIGTAKYASIHVHCGHRYSRRDDMISLGYVLMFLIGLQESNHSFLFEKISIPVSELPKTDIQHPLNQHLLKRKMENLQECIAICEMTFDLSVEKNRIIYMIAHYLKKVYALEYADKPNYLDYLGETI